MNYLAILICGILFRLDGWGKGDGFLPIRPFDKLRMGGFNYARYLIAAMVFLVSNNPWHLLTYTIASSIPYGEKHWWMKYGIVSWFLIGTMWGAASLHIGMMLWMGCAIAIAKSFDMDQAWLEFGMFGIGSTIWLAFK